MDVKVPSNPYRAGGGDLRPRLLYSPAHDPMFCSPPSSIYTVCFCPTVKLCPSSQQHSAPRNPAKP